MYDSEERFWITVWGIAALTLVGIVTVVSIHSTRQIEQYTNSGYCQAQKVGSTSFVWTKCK